MRAISIFFLLVLPSVAVAQDVLETTETPVEVAPVASGLNPDYIANSYLHDRNGDGVLTSIAFGDSLVRGVGDFVAVGEDIPLFTLSPPADGVEAGYPLRLEANLQISVQNYGNPGEQFIADGLYRFARLIPGARADLVFISGGSNDAFTLASPSEFHRAMQTAVNIALASGALPVLLTVSPTCCGHAGIDPIVSLYNAQVEAIATYNSLPLADVNKGFRNTCVDSECFLLNLPEGLHPNIEGYDVYGEVIAAALLKIDIFAPDGPATLETALNFLWEQSLQNLIR